MPSIADKDICSETARRVHEHLVGGNVQSNKHFSHTIVSLPVAEEMSARKELRIMPRTTRAEGTWQESKPVVLNIEKLKEHFTTPLNVAARKLGVCVTALKRLESCHPEIFEDPCVTAS
jgi:hypothetical protein